MTDDEQAQRDLIALQLDAVLAIMAVELRKETVRPVEQPKRVRRTRPAIAKHWLERKAS